MTDHNAQMPEEIFVKEFSNGDETVLEALYIEANEYQRYIRADLVEKMKEPVTDDALREAIDKLQQLRWILELPENKTINDALETVITHAIKGGSK